MAKVENDWRESVGKLAQAHDVSQNGSLCSHENLHLSKKSARCVNRRLRLEMKKEQFRTCEADEAMAAAIL